MRVDDGAAIIKFLQGGAKGSIRVHGKVLMIPQTPFLRVAGPALWGFLKAYVDLLLTMKVASSGPLLFNFIRKKPVRAHSSKIFPLFFHFNWSVRTPLLTDTPFLSHLL